MQDTIMLKEIPKFNYNVSNPRAKQFGYIVVADDVLFHRVSNFDEFYRTLGYSKDDAEAGVLPEEFVWDRYCCSGASKSLHCLQVQISVYLYNHSGIFRELFGHKYESLLGKCDSDEIDESYHCLKCPMNPVLVTEEF